MVRENLGLRKLTFEETLVEDEMERTNLKNLSISTHKIRTILSEDEIERLLISTLINPKSNS